MLVSKFVRIEFAHPDIHAADAIHDIRKAAESAGLNLFSRYDVQLQMPILIGEDKVVVELKIPEQIADSFAFGNHLRGISAYLLKYCNGRYDNFLVGNRLLTYTVERSSRKESAELSIADRLEAIVIFARLLERTDSQATDYINQILTILNEVNSNP